MYRVPLAVAFAAALLLAVAASAAAHPTRDATPVVFTDAVGDSGTASDISGVTVTNDEAGLYSFNIGFATPYASTSELFVYFNADKDRATGDPDIFGADYVLIESEKDGTWGYYKWVDGAWGNAPSSASIRFFVSGDQKEVAFSLDKSDLGDSTKFQFIVFSDRTDESLDFDDGPTDQGGWEYALQLPMRLVAAGAKAMSVKAGGTWVFVLLTRRSDTGEYLGGEGTITCSASSGSLKLARTTRAFVSGGGGTGTGAACSFKVPKKLKHKVLHGTITVSYQGASVTKTFTTTVK